MWRFTIFISLFFSFPTLILGQQSTVSGFIVDAETEEKLIGCNIFDTILNKGTVTNNYGFFSYSSGLQNKNLNFSYVGYQSQEFSFQIDKDTSVIIKLVPLVELEGIEVTANRNTPEKEEMSVHFLQIKDIKILPTVSGEIDLMKSLQLLPGVQSGSEGQTGLYVRGGSPDQNLILIDDVPIYYASHALGFLSVFNADAIKNVSLTKGAFPARFGGRLSSVLEVRMKEGNLRESQVEGAIGLLASKITVEGPLKKDKTSFMLSARRTYLDLLARPIIKNLSNSSLGGKVRPSIYFYDLNGKIHHIINKNHSVYLSTYLGADEFSFKYKSREDEYGGGTRWQNFITSFRWNSLWNNKLFSNTTLYYSKYNININSSFNYTRDGEDRIYSSTYLSGIRDIGLKLDFDFIPTPSHYIKFGGSIVAHQYYPGAVSINSLLNEVSIDTAIGTRQIDNIENDLYLEDEITYGRFKANIGLHGSMLNTKGKNFFSLQPRIMVSFRWTDNLFLKSSYSQTTQYLNLLTSDILNLPSDIWVPSTQKILPQTAVQYALGISATLQNELKFSVEGYFKKMENLLAYKEGTSFDSGAGDNWENAVTQGTGNAYGIEFFLQKQKGKTTGWLGYTLSWNWRHFQELNSGNRFPFRYDRRHDISIFVAHQLKKNIKLSAVWVYSTGNAISLPAYRYAVSYSSSWSDFEQRLYEFYGGILKVNEKNVYRLSSYHRLDLSIEFFKKKKKYERTWKISTYNTYFHSNPYIILPSYIKGSVSFNEISLLPFLIPSVSYQFKF